MTDPTRAHLTEADMNEYLDAALVPEALAAAEAHLAACVTCSYRLADLRALFADLDALPDVPLPRDLVPAVVRALPAAHTPLVSAKRPWLGLMVGAQLLVTLAALALAWPYAAARLSAPAAWAASASVWVIDAVSLAQGLANALPLPGQLWADVQKIDLAGWSDRLPQIAGGLPLQALLAVTTVAGLLWLATNMWLWQQRPGRSVRRTP